MNLIEIFTASALFVISYRSFRSEVQARKIQYRIDLIEKTMHERNERIDELSSLVNDMLKK